jgi:ribosomal protein S12 methylthiotransferase
MKVYLESLGCARNQVDSEAMLGKLDLSGWEIAEDPADAEVIVVNTCGFIEPAAEESIDTILSLSEYKKTGKCRRLVVTGCLPQRYGKEIADALPEVDFFLGTGGYDQILSAVDPKSGITGCSLPDPEAVDVRSVEYRRPVGSSHTAYLKIAEGCDRHCTYCIIPRLRGRQRSRPVETLVQEAMDLIQKGARELVLVAQESTRYGADFSNGSGRVTLSDLLRRLSEVAGDTWLRVMYGHPDSLSESMIETIASLPNVCPYFDIPIQHASPSILKRMGRGYEPERLRDLISRIRRIAPHASLRTTVIVGFPGETEEDFDALMDFVEAVRFDHLGAFTYSDGEDLPAHALSDPVDPETAEERRDLLMARQQLISMENNRRFLGQTLPVLIEENPEPGVYLGRTMFQAPEVDGVTFVDHDGPGLLAIGQVVPVTITDTLEYDLMGCVHD